MHSSVDNTNQTLWQIVVIVKAISPWHGFALAGVGCPVIQISSPAVIKTGAHPKLFKVTILPIIQSSSVKN